MSVPSLRAGETLRGCTFVIQNDIGSWNPPEGFDAKNRARLSSNSDVEQMRQPAFLPEGTQKYKFRLGILIGGLENTYKEHVRFVTETHHWFCLQTCTLAS